MHDCGWTLFSSFSGLSVVELVRKFRHRVSIYLKNLTLLFSYPFLDCEQSLCCSKNSDRASTIMEVWEWWSCKLPRNLLLTALPLAHLHYQTHWHWFSRKRETVHSLTLFPLSLSRNATNHKILDKMVNA